MTELTPASQLLTRLISFPTVSDTSNGAISDWVESRLVSLGFEVERTTYQDAAGTAKANLVARRAPNAKSGASESGGLAYFCHTDVVPADRWHGPGGDPFAAEVTNGRIYGRGACDMKGSLAAMLDAAASFHQRTLESPLWIVCTADEEVGFEGAKHLVTHSSAMQELSNCQPVCIIGEPTSLSVVNAHKGIQGLRIISHGRAAHSSTPHGINANRAMVPMLDLLLDLEQATLEQPRYRDERFEPSTLSWNFGVSDGCRAVNITPERSVAWVSFRPTPSIQGEDLVERVLERANQLGLEVQRLSGGSPMWVDANAECIRGMVDLAGGPPRTVCYGTDGGEFASLKQRVVCGPGDIAQAHTSDEWISFEQLEHGVDLYRRAIQRWCNPA